MQFERYYEVTGSLSEVKNRCAVFIFTILQEIEIKITAISSGLLKEAKGKSIGLFNNSGDYKIGVIEK